MGCLRFVHFFNNNPANLNFFRERELVIATFITIANVKLNFNFAIGDTTTVTLYVSRSNAQFLWSVIQGTINCSWVFALLTIESKEKSFAAMGAANIPYVHHPKEGILFFFHKVADLMALWKLSRNQSLHSVTISI